MARRPTEKVTLTCPLSEEEQNFVADMMRMTRISTQCNITRLGLWHLAKHLNLPIRNAFGQRRTYEFESSRLTRKVAERMRTQG